MASFSKFGSKFTEHSGILQLMDDLGKANTSGDSDICMLGGGNPAFIPEAQELYRQEMHALLDEGDEFDRMLCLYDGPKGSERFIQALVKLLNDRYNWNLTGDNICLTNGSQSSFFSLFNMLAGEMPDGSTRKILFPLAPEYIGYFGLGVSEDMFTANKPSIELIGEQQFKYHVDFDALTIDEDIAAICVSRPTNPTGNVITDAEIDQLDQLARQHNIPLIIDNAYGFPFPGAIYTDVNPQWNENIILTMSLSKLGLPGTRTGIVIANTEIIAALRSINAITALAPSSVGANLMSRIIERGELIHLRDSIIRPFYKDKAERAVAMANDIFAGTSVRVHKAEGAFFLWLWCDGMPISSVEMYQRLAEQNVYVIPGEHFFIGMEESWNHQWECLRVTYTQPDELIERGLKTIADQLQSL